MAESSRGHVIGLLSKGMARVPFLEIFLAGDVKVLGWHTRAPGVDVVAGWGRKRSGRNAESLARRHGIQALFVEDGFLRSFGTGERFPPLALIVDDEGIFYDGGSPCALESSLLSPGSEFMTGAADVQRAKLLMLEHQLSKYNHAPALDSQVFRAGDASRVLVVDQTFDDLSVTLGGACRETFTAMLAAARLENPGATIYVKTHPEVSSGRKRGYLADVQDDERTVVLRQAINPMSLIERMDRVYVVSSTMGFEALLAGKPVTCFGLPWYAGWGVTDDRQACPRRNRKRSVDELFAAAYFHYTRYLNPTTHERGTIFDVIDWLVRQRQVAARIMAPMPHGRMIAVGFRRWKAVNVKPLLSLDPRQVLFVPGRRAVEAAAIGPQDRLVWWGRDAPSGVLELAERRGAQVLHMEDGFIRSVGLGSDLIRPLSVVLDSRGIYFDATRPSDLEHVLGTVAFSSEELACARRVREFIVEHGITKYNLEPREKACWATDGRLVLLVPGQVEDDASIRFGCLDIKTNLGLLQAVRRAHPEAFIVYKPHPDVMSGNRSGKIALDEARRWADHVETRLSVVSCIEASDEVHTMTSLTGFDALLRGRRVVTYGQPFYAGWGLTRDTLTDGPAFDRRRRVLNLDQLVAGALLRYPIYWDWDLKGYTSCEAVLHRIVETRDSLQASGGLEKLRIGFWRRQWRKLGILVKALAS